MKNLLIILGLVVSFNVNAQTTVVYETNNYYYGTAPTTTINQSSDPDLSPPPPSTTEAKGWDYDHHNHQEDEDDAYDDVMPDIGTGDTYNTYIDKQVVKNGGGGSGIIRNPIYSTTPNNLWGWNPWGQWGMNQFNNWNRCPRLCTYTSNWCNHSGGWLNFIF